MRNLLRRSWLFVLVSMGCAAPRPTAYVTAPFVVSATADPACVPPANGSHGVDDAAVCGLEQPYSDSTADILGRPDPLKGLVLESQASRPYDFVVLLSIDGFRPDAISARTPTLLRLKQEATWADQAFTIARSLTLPSHAAMVSGVDVDLHGVDFNAYRPGFGTIRFPSVMQVAQRAGLQVGMFVAKYKLIHLIDPGSIEAFRVGGIRCERVADQATEFIAQAQAGFAFVHFSETDAAGHRYGWMTGRYLQAAARADRCAGLILDAVARRDDPERTLLIITSDHGGNGKHHLGANRDCRQIPWIGNSARLAPAQSIAREISTMDTAATVLAALGLPIPHGTVGSPVIEVLAGGAPESPIVLQAQP